ncbi:uncharacterized protein [Embiotoca jacksoni]|uniref:uncharacterized protein n=1 Tax=Embiotoca jacksoni TaxID=100190 RepID=UPI0037049145
MVTQLDRQHGRIWTSEVCSDQCYPPPNLQALLKLVLVPRIDNVSVQAILMYFILDVANFLQCKDNLLQSFCNAFTIPPSFSQQIRAFWMFDHGHVKASMELLLSPRATVPWLSWQHRCILHSLLTRKQPQVALRYLQWTRPATETVEDAKLCADVLLQSGCVPDAWALLKRGHTESEDMLQTCIGITREEDFCGVETTKTPLMKKERPLCPLSAQLYRTQTVNTVSPEELLKLVRQAVMEVRKPRPKISELVWPQLAERKSNGREIFVSAEALHHLTPSPAPMDTAEETEQTACMDEEQEQPVIYNQQQPETQNNISSSEDLSSRSSSSFTSASSLPPLKQNASHVYQSTLTLQRISSLLTGGQNQSREEEEEEESRTPSSTDGLSDCPELMLTPGGATDSVSLSSLNKDKLEELMLFAEGGEEDVFAGEDIFSVALSGPSLDFCVDTRLNLQHQPQSVPEILSPDNEKWACCKDVVVQDLPRVTPLCSSLMPLNKDNQSDGIPSQISLSEVDTSDYFLEKKLSQKACEHQEELLGYASQDLSCTPPGTTRDLLTDYLNPGLTCNIKTTSAPSDATDERLAKSKFKTNEPRVPHTSAWPDHFKAGSWWEQSGLSFPTEPRAAITSDNKRPSLVLHQPYTQSQVSFMDFTAMQKGDGKQTEKEEPAGWSSLGKASQGVIRSGRTRAGKGKRVKRT